MLQICVQTNETNPSKSLLLLILMYLKTALAFVTIREKQKKKQLMGGLMEILIRGYNQLLICFEKVCCLKVAQLSFK